MVGTTSLGSLAAGNVMPPDQSGEACVARPLVALCAAGAGVVGLEVLAAHGVANSARCITLFSRSFLFLHEVAP